MAITDHGTVTGDVSVDASTSKTHVFNLTAAGANILEPTGCVDGDTVTFVFTTIGYLKREGTWGFQVSNSIESPMSIQGAPQKYALMKLGSIWI